MMRKTCIECKETHLISFFYKHPDTKDGLRKACKNCVSLKSYGKEHQGTINKFNTGRKKSKEFENGTKLCIGCNEIKDKSNFIIDSKRYNTLSSQCTICLGFKAIKRNFGINKEEYLQLLENQGGVCAICKNSEPFYTKLPVDHCHTTGKVRGLLCSFCNKSLGGFKDNIEYLKSAITYLEDSKKTK